MSCNWQIIFFSWLLFLKLIFQIPVDCCITYLRFPLPHPITPQATFDCWVLIVNGLPFAKQKQRQNTNEENLNRTASYPAPTAVVVVVLLSWCTPITNTITIIMQTEVYDGWRCLELTMQLLCYFGNGFAMSQEYGCVDTLLVRWFWCLVVVELVCRL